MSTKETGSKPQRLSDLITDLSHDRHSHHYLYLSGPMSGIPEHNFPAFRAATANLRAQGFLVHSPDEDQDDPGETVGLALWPYYLRKDLVHLWDTTGVVVLPGWEKSDGARLEVLIARHIWMPIYEYPTLHRISDEVLDEHVGAKFAARKAPDDYVAKQSLPYDMVRALTAHLHETKAEQQEIDGIPVDELLDVYRKYKATEEKAEFYRTGNIADIAKSLVCGDRNDAYGHPYHDFKRSAKIITGILMDKLKDGTEVSALDISLIMQGVKISRVVNTPTHRDSPIDGIGYWLTYAMVVEKMKELGEI